MPTFATVRLTVEELLEDWRPLVDANWREYDADGSVFLPDLRIGYGYEQLGRARCVGLLEDDEKIGYAVIVSYDDLFRMGCRRALLLALYVRPDRRTFAAARTLLREAVRAAAEMGCRRLVAASRHPAGGACIDPLLRRAGFRPQEVWYVREL